MAWIDEREGAKLPVRVDWTFGRRADRAFGYVPPTLIQRFWIVPAEVAMFLGIGLSRPDMFALWVAPLILAALYWKIRVSDMHNNHGKLWGEIFSLRAALAHTLQHGPVGCDGCPGAARCIPTWFEEPSQQA